MKNNIRFKELLTLVGEKYGVEISRSMAKTIWQVLKPFPDADCEEALMKIVLYGRFYKDLLPDLMEALEGSKSDQATEAWIEVDRAIKQIGIYATVKFSNPIIHSCIKAMGGWEALGNVTSNEWKWKQKEFEKLYPIMARHRTHPEMLLGTCDRENIALGFKDKPEPVLIGGDDDLVQLPDAERTKAIPADLSGEPRKPRSGKSRLHLPGSR